jgi:Uma2 family endonuclease
MVALPDNHYISPDEYLALEAQSPTKHEHHNGEAFEMAGAVDEHVTVAMNCSSLLLAHLRGSGCRVYMSDMKATSR